MPLAFRCCRTGASIGEWYFDNYSLFVLHNGYAIYCFKQTTTLVVFGDNIIKTSYDSIYKYSV